jgi:hypothetical protein
MPRSLLSLAVTAALALGVLSTAVAAPRLGGGEDAHVALTAATGAAAIANSREGAAVVTAGGLRPGGSASGSVRIANDGDGAGTFALEAADILDVPGALGGRLSERLHLTVTDSTRTVYAGPLTGLGRAALGRFEAGEARTYAITVAFPDGDNSYQGSAASFDLRWHAVTDAAPPADTPPAETPPAAPPAGTAPPQTGDDGLGLPSADRCLKRGRLRLRVRPPAGVSVRRATVLVNGRRKAVLTGRRLRRTLTLRKLPRRATVKLVVRTSAGKTITVTRRYRSCPTRR